jgi:hypothetical protein
MAALIPQSDQRLGTSRVWPLDFVLMLTFPDSGSVDRYGIDIVNFASDFIAQYTTRQEYRYAEVSQPSPGNSVEDKSGLSSHTLCFINLVNLTV